METPTDVLVGIEAAAEFLGMTKGQAVHLLRNGNLPVKRVGRRLYFRKSELNEAFSARATH